MESLYARARSIILPGTAGPDEAAILIGPDLPPCMQARYSSAIFFRPPGTVSNSINRPMKYIGQVINPVSEQVDEGMALWDQTTGGICGYYAYKTTIAPLAPSGSGNSVPQEFYGDIAQAGVATMTGGGSTNFGSDMGSPPNVPWALNIGGNYSPFLAPFRVDGRDQPRGVVAAVCSQADSGAIGAETVVLTLGSPLVPPVFRNGRAFEIRVKVAFTATIAGFGILLVKRGNSTAGVAVAEWEMPSVAGGAANCATFTQQLRNASGTDISQQMVLTFIQTAGTGNLIDAGPFGPFYLEVWDIGDATDYADLNSI